MRAPYGPRRGCLRMAERACYYCQDAESPSDSAECSGCVAHSNFKPTPESKVKIVEEDSE
jgi:hypothetical protein